MSVDAIKDAIKEELDNNLNLISISNLKTKILAKYGEELENKLLIEKLIEDLRFIQINSRQFIVKDVLYNYISKNRISDLLKHRKHDQIQSEVKDIILSNFPVLNIDVDKLLEDLKRKELSLKNSISKSLISKLVIIFQNYYTEKKEAVSFNDYSFQVKYLDSVDCNIEYIVKILENNSLFYKLTSKKFALRIWIIDGIIKELFLFDSLARFREVEMQVRNILASKAINKNNLIKLFNDNKHFELKSNQKFVKLTSSKDELYNDLKKSYKAKINSDAFECLFKKNKNVNNSMNINIEEYLSAPIKINQLKEISEITLDSELLIYKLLSYSDIYYDNGYILRIEEPTLDKIMSKINILFNYLKENNLLLNKLLYNLFYNKNKALKLKEIKNYFKIIFSDQFKFSEILRILKNEENFIQIDYQTWIDKRSYSPRYENFSERFNEDFNLILERLSNREEYILKNRLLTHEENKKSLESIGNEFGVSRERIRQVEKKIINKLSHPTYIRNYRRYFKLLENVFRSNRIIKISDFFKHPIIVKFFPKANLEFLINFYNQFNDNLETKEIITLKGKYLLFLKEEYYNTLWQRVEDELTNEEGIANLEDVCDFFAKFKIKNRDFLIDIINGSDNKMMINNLILIKDGRIYTSDKLIFILSLLDTPTHYSQITELYNQYFEESSDHNIHSKLVMYDQFVRVDSGTYGLSSWGCQEHIYIRDLNCQILKKANKPLHYQEITKRVLEYKDAEEKTVYAFLLDNNKIFNYSQGVFALKEWKEDDYLSKKYRISGWRVKCSEEDTSYDYLLGSCLGRKDRFISLHKLSKAYIEEGYVSISKKIVDNSFLKNNSFAADNLGQFYQLYFNVNSKKLWGLKPFYKNNNLQVGDLIYIEYYDDGVIKFHKEEEYQEDYKAITKEDLIMGKNADNDFAVNKIMNIIFGDSIDDDINSLDEAIEYGINNGYIKFDDLLELDYEQEEVNDHFEAIQLLDDRNIEIVYE
ncbi:sigma factor-like helix-turn-helix DNA-binding protein [Orenia marismortui]|uniref:RNA polymerase sigma factor (Sigma-70 family) n=1 Tax=Orenia marismortui TaxID=46469 RepID=A0A4R8H1D1_9FIRM|nr:sigma factor-like helix-turn-helix DNA-binding protein [Orenia marismortui]TDX53244.1 RNA polymerase sigma factor (sigma-70 family) [Orenia marismortui]